MGHVSAETRESIVYKAINRNNQEIKAIAALNNIGYSTLQRWLREYRANTGGDRGKDSKTHDQLSRSEKFGHLLTTTGLDETALGIYCREQGIYSHQLAAWKQDIMNDSSEKTVHLRHQLKQVKAENKRLKKDLNRKDKALAETSALLVQKKKADLIWGGSEEN